MFSRIAKTSVTLPGGWSTTVRICGKSTGTPLILVHGNLASSLLYANVMQKLPEDVFAIAYDVRGYGDSTAPPINPTLGLSDYSTELLSLMDLLRLPKAHTLGWSLGGGILQTFLLSHSHRVLSTTLEAPAPPFGFGGMRGKEGIPCYSDFAGSGGGLAHPALVEALRTKDVSEGNLFSVRNVFNRIVWNPPYRPPGRLEDLFLEDICKAKIGPDYYPGEVEKTENFPGFAPGKRGVNNGLSGKYMNCLPVVKIKEKPKIVWVRGEDDQIVSDAAAGCPGTLGQKGFIKHWPGEAVFPPQPMIAQTRYLLDLYKQEGGQAEEVVFAKCGHSPHLEQEDKFMKVITDHLRSF